MYVFQYRRSDEENTAMYTAIDELGKNYPTHKDWINIIIYTRKVWFNHKDIGVYGEYNVTQIMRTLCLKHTKNVLSFCYLYLRLT